MEDIFCKLISECGKEKLFLILLLIISLLKYVINKLIFNTFPKIELEQNNYKSEIKINREAIDHLDSNKDFKCMVVILEIVFFINVIIYKILFNNFLYFYSIVIGFFLLIMCVVIGIYYCCEKSKKTIKDCIFQVSKDILSLLILKSLVYSQFTSKKVFKEYYNCILYYVKFYFVFSLFIMIYSIFRSYFSYNELFITYTFFLSILIIHVINVFITLLVRNESMLQFSYMSVANILALMFVISTFAIFITKYNLCGCNLDKNYFMTLSSEANCINLIILMATNYRCKKYFKEA